MQLRRRANAIGTSPEWHQVRLPKDPQNRELQPLFDEDRKRSIASCRRERKVTAVPGSKAANGPSRMDNGPAPKDKEELFPRRAPIAVQPSLLTAAFFVLRDGL